MDETDWSLISFDKPSHEPKKFDQKMGVCGKCGKFVGKGLFRHMKKCEG